MGTIRSRRTEDYKKNLFKMATFHLLRDNARQFYWILKSDENHKTIAKSSESYDSSSGAIHGLEWVRKYARGAKFKDHTQNENN